MMSQKGGKKSHDLIERREKLPAQIFWLIQKIPLHQKCKLNHKSFPLYRIFAAENCLSCLMF